MTANEYIKILRTYTPSAPPNTVPTEQKFQFIGNHFNSKEEFLEEFGHLGDNIRQVIDNLGHDEIRDYTLQQSIIRPLLLYLPNDIAKILSEITFCTLTTRVKETNAYTVKVPNGDIVVIFSAKFMRLFSFFSLSMQLIRLGQETPKQMYDTIIAYFNDETDSLPSLSQSVEFSPEDKQTALLACLSMELFIVLHEYAHAYLGHLDSYSDECIFDNDEHSVVAFQTTHKKELDADVQAIKWLYYLIEKCNRKDDPQFFGTIISGMIYAGEVLFIIGLAEIVELSKNKDLMATSYQTVREYMNEKEGVSEDNDFFQWLHEMAMTVELVRNSGTTGMTHPSAISRLMYILNECYDILNENQIKQIQSSIRTLATKINELIEDRLTMD